LELNYYKKLIKNPSLLIILDKDAEVDSLSWLIKPYAKVKRLNKWLVYY